MKGMRALSNDEYQRLVNVFRERSQTRDLALVITGVHLGVRIGELLSLRFKDVLGQDGQILERVYVERKNTKGKLEGRCIPLHQEARNILSRLIQMNRPSPESYIYQSRKGENKPITRRQAWFVLKQAFRKAGLEGKLGTHSLRKTFANRIYERVKHDLLKTKTALGHKNINSTISYLSFRQDEVDEAILGV